MKNKNIYILGMARSGYEAAKILAKNNKVLITDMADQNEAHVNELLSLGVNYVVTNYPEELLDKSFDLVVKNPGINQDHKVVKKALELKIPVVNEIEVAYNLLPSDVIIVGVTGSNGKTTTVTIIYKMLQLANKPVHLAGNIGFPLCSFVDKIKPKDILVIEVSSHQLVNFEKFKTNISVLTNLSETHLDFFKTYDNYVRNKKRIFRHHTSEELSIINLNNFDSMELTKNINSKKQYFSIDKKTDAYIEDDNIYYNNEEIIKLKDIKVKGDHNYENIMCAIMVVKQFGVNNKVIKSVLKDFGGVEHRIEYVKNVNDREFYNDSKSTNVNSTQIALRSFNSPIILLLGGLDRGLSFDELKNDMDNVKHIVCFGETKNIIKDFAKQINIPCTVTETLEQGVKESYKISDPHDTILLSPACASWDQYKTFEERGDDFKRVINKLN